MPGDHVLQGTMILMMHLSQIPDEIIMFGISPMTTEMFIARGSLFRKERPATCNLPRDQDAQ